MKVKNIAFSGFAAMILAGVCGVANAASVNLASKTYVDTQLETKADLIDLEALETTVGKKATQESLELVATQVNQNTLDIAELQGKGYITKTDLDNLQTTLEAAIADKQDKGEYAAASELESLKATVETLQGGTVDKTTVDNLQTSVNTIVADYAKKSELTATEEKLQAAIDAIKIPDLTEYAKIAYVDEQLALKANASALTDLVTSQQLTDLRTALEAEIANKQAAGDYATAEALTAVSSELATLTGDVYTKAQVDQKIAEAATGGEIDLSGYAEKSALDALTALVNGNTTKITALENAGYQTSDDVQGAITTAVADLATKAELGGYLTSDDLTELQTAVSELKTGKADASTVATIQETISKLGDTYATDDDLTSAINDVKAMIPSLEGYVKSGDLAAVATSGSYNDLSDKPEIPSIDGLATTEALNTLQSTLQAAIDEKQAAGDYLVADDLTELQTAVANLQSGKADASTVEAIQTTISKLGDTYATDAEVSTAIANVQSAIDNIDLSAYAKTADVYTQEQANAKFLIMQDANALGANLQWDEDGKLNTKGIATAEGLEELESKVASAVTESELTAKGYQTATDVADAIATAVDGKQDKLTAGTNITITDNTISADVDLSGLATKAEVEAKQDALTAGTGITITDNTISASVDTSSFVPNPTTTPTTYGEYVLMLSIGEDGTPEGYDWLDTLDLMGDSGFEM